MSRQHLILRDISSIITSCSHSSVSFDPIEWITEAVACGLIQEFDDMDFDISQALKDAEGSEWLTRQAMGLDTLPANLLEQLDMMDAEEEEVRDDDCFEGGHTTTSKEGKRKGEALYNGSGIPAKRSLRERKDYAPTWKYLSPAWVMIANCLFNHGMWKELENLERLIAASTERDDDIDPRAFMRRWLWLRWLGKKISLEGLLSPVFSEDDSVVNVSGLKNLSLCVNSVSFNLLCQSWLR